jgi:hypothetical protein
MPTGWLCPRCDTVLAPHVDACGICTGKPEMAAEVATANPETCDHAAGFEDAGAFLRCKTCKAAL